MPPKKNPPENACDVIAEMASRGCSEVSIAAALGCSYHTYTKWKDEHPELKEALKVGYSVEHNLLVGCLHQAAMNGNAPAAMFLLKTRHGYVEGKQHDPQDRRIQIAVTLPQALTPEQYSQITHKAQETVDAELVE